MTVAYPHLTEVLVLMFHDNYGRMMGQHVKPIVEWRWPTNVVELERQAAMLTLEEKEIVAAGEETEVMQLIGKTHCRKLHNFLAEVFDGELSEGFIRLAEPKAAHR